MANQAFKELSKQGRVTSTYLPSDLFQYLEAVARTRNLPISAALRSIIQDHFDEFVKSMHKTKKKAR